MLTPQSVAPEVQLPEGPATRSKQIFQSSVLSQKGKLLSPYDKFGSVGSGVH